MVNRSERLRAGGIWLLRKRGEHSISQRALAAQLNRTAATVSNWERGVNEVPEEATAQLAEIFDLPEWAVRQGLGMYVPEIDGFDERVIHLPEDVTEAEREALQQIVQTSLAAFRRLTRVPSDTPPSVTTDTQPEAHGPHTPAGKVQADDLSELAIAASGLDPALVTPDMRAQVLEIAKRVRAEHDAGNEEFSSGAAGR